MSRGDELDSPYSSHPQAYFDRYEALVPTRLYELCRVFFKKGAPTLDIGCGSGRDVNWLTENSYPAQGVDAAGPLLELAKKHRPHLGFHLDSLPDLKSLENEACENLLCSGVLMHLNREEQVRALMNILRVMKLKGRAVLSVRNKGSDTRDFHDIEDQQLQYLLESLGAKVLLIDKTPHHERKEVEWTTFVFEKVAGDRAAGLKRVQSIIQEDRKTATYKLALLRALCAIARYEPGVVAWFPGDPYVKVPASRVAYYWARYYYGLLKAGLRQTSNHKPAFAEKLLTFRSEAELSLALMDSGEAAGRETEAVLKKIASVILDMPVKHIGGGEHYSLFQKVEGKGPSVFRMGAFKVPAEIWRDLCVFALWVEDSLVMEWARKTRDLNEEDPKAFEKCLTLLHRDLECQRSTVQARKLLKKGLGDQPVRCVWTDRKIELSGKEQDSNMDHLLPFAYWQSNDLWNLLPAHAKVNNLKRDKVPALDLLRKRRERILEYWQVYEREAPGLFAFQRERALSVSGYSGGRWENWAFDGLCFLAERGISTYGLTPFTG